jgi:23S rRNA (uracil-5-)-methyltransferase RumA
MHSLTPYCPVAGECGGCALIGRPYGDQLDFKTARVREAFARWGELPVDRIESCLPAPQPLAYRNRAKLAVAREGDGVRIGLFRRGTNAIVDLAPCRVQRPVLQEAMERLRGWLGRYRLAGPEGPVIYLDLREAAEERCHVTLVMAGDGVAPEDLPLAALADDWPGLAGCAVNFGDARSSYAMGPVTEVFRGAATFLAPLPSAGGQSLAFEVPPAGFFQVASSALGAVHDLMTGHLDGAGPLCDLYCGVGVHGLVVASRAAEPMGLVGIEESEPLVEAARKNAARMGIEAHYEAGTVEQRLPVLLETHPAERIILNPGRAGCRPGVVDRLLASGASRLAYLSCNPETLARDLSEMSRGGLDLVRAVPVDLMPQTDQVEVLALVRRRGI